MSFPPDTLDTDRLHLRRPSMDDARAVFDSYASDPQVPRYMTWPTHTSLDDTLGFLEDAVVAWDTGSGHRVWLMELQGEPGVVGSIGATVKGCLIEVGYVIARPLWGRGLTTEALIAVCDAAFRDPDIYRVQALCDVDNVASARVMEKAGMIHEGTLRRYMIHPAVSAEPRDCHIYALVR